MRFSTRRKIESANTFEGENVKGVHKIQKQKGARTQFCMEHKNQTENDFYKNMAYLN